MSGDLAAGRLLISSAALADSTFARTVVLLLEADEGGTLGVVLNQPTTTEVDTVLPEWAHLAAGPAVVHRGGPCDTDSALGLAMLGTGSSTPSQGGQPAVSSQDWGPHGWRPLASEVLPRTGLVDLDAPTGPVVGSVVALRIYVGYAGWSPGQLEAEVAQGSWHVVPALVEDLFCADADALWRQVTRRQGGEVAMLVTMPTDPTMN